MLSLSINPRYDYRLEINMKIYISNKIRRVYFYDDFVTFFGDLPITKQNLGLSHTVFCICNGINDFDQIAHSLIDKFALKSDLETVKRMIHQCTIADTSIEHAFVLNSNEANNNLIFNGIVGKRYPDVLHIELTSQCNFMCSHCYKNALNVGESVCYKWLSEKIYDRLKQQIPIIHLTGGEPTLHKDFSKIVDLFANDFDLQLTTNGSRITTYSMEVFKKFQAIDISLYGLSGNEYKVNTGSAESYNLVMSGCRELKAADINFGVTLVINAQNWTQLENYVEYAIRVGAKSISFALPMNSGRLINSNSDKWFLSPETKKNIYKCYRSVSKKYKDDIIVREWTRSAYSNMWNSYPSDDSLRCGAGRTNWWMSEQKQFRPCSFLPNEYICLDYDEWIKYITKESNIDWKNSRKLLEVFASKNDLKITDICPIFRKE